MCHTRVHGVLSVKHIYFKVTSKNYWNKAPALLAALTGLPGSEEMVVVDWVEERVSLEESAAACTSTQGQINDLIR